MNQKEKLVKNKNKYPIGFRVFQALGYILFGSVVMFFAYLNDATLQTAIGLAAFFSIRYSFAKTFHCKTVTNCMVVSILIFVIFGIICLPLTISILTNVILSFCITLVFYILRDYLDKKELYDYKVNIKIQRGMTLNSLDTVLENVRISPTQYSILKGFYVERKNLNNIAFELHYSYDYINELKKKALIKIKQFYKL